MCGRLPQGFPCLIVRLLAEVATLSGVPHPGMLPIQEQRTMVATPFAPK